MHTVAAFALVILAVVIALGLFASAVVLLDRRGVHPIPDPDPRGRSQDVQRTRDADFARMNAKYLRVVRRVRQLSVVVGVLAVVTLAVALLAGI